MCAANENIYTVSHLKKFICNVKSTPLHSIYREKINKKNCSTCFLVSEVLVKNCFLRVKVKIKSVMKIYSEIHPRSLEF